MMPKISRGGSFSAFVFTFALFCQGFCLAEYNHLVRASQLSSGTSANAASLSVELSNDETYLVFTSAASNLANSDLNGVSDIFLYKISDASVTLISRAPNGNSANAASVSPVVSENGAYVAFVSDATDLINSDSNAVSDVFVYERSSGAITRVSVSSSAAQANAASHSPSISADGRYVVFVSDATNLVSADTNSKSDVFLHDRNTATTTRISVSTALLQADGDSNAPFINLDGTHVAYVSDATNLVSADTNSAKDIFLYALSGATTTRISFRSNGLETNGDSYQPALNSDASYLVWTSDATNIVSNDSNAVSDVFFRNLSSGAVERLSVSAAGSDGDGASFSPRISSLGTLISFTSLASNLVNGDTNAVSDVFVRDRTNSVTSRVSVSSAAQQANGASLSASINADLQYVAFLSDATNFVSSDSNSLTDVFLINVECLVDLGTSPSTDTDGDATVNCSEDCGADASKTSAGTCGCGVSDVDTDGDSSADCNDECDSDAAKSSAGTCGCGVADTDSNGNTVPDCNDPTTSTLPRKVAILRKRDTATIIFPGDFTGVTYRFTLRKPDGSIVQRSTRRVRYKLNGLSRGVYRLTYTVNLGATTSRSSQRVSFRVK